VFQARRYSAVPGFSFLCKYLNYPRRLRLSAVVRAEQFVLVLLVLHCATVCWLCSVCGCICLLSVAQIAVVWCQSGRSHTLYPQQISATVGLHMKSQCTLACCSPSGTVLFNEAVKHVVLVSQQLMLFWFKVKLNLAFCVVLVSPRKQHVI
jgi:hypothetical protein